MMRNKRFFGLISLTVVHSLASVLASAAETKSDGWISLFNGKDLSGWTVRCQPRDQGKTFWRVDQGAILCDSIGQKDHNYVWLMTEKAFGDFELRLKFQAYRNAPGNSGLQFRSRFDESAQGGWLDGPQVDIHPPADMSWRTGLIYDETRGEQRWVSPSLKDWQMDPKFKPAQFVFKYADDEDGWNELVLICRGMRVKTILNGIVRTDWDAAGVLNNAAHQKRQVGQKGHFALQLHSGDELRIRFKDIQVKPLANLASADEPLGWRLGPAAWSFNRFTFFEAVEKTAALGLRYLEAFEGQQVKPDSDWKIDAHLPDQAVAEIRQKLAAARVQLTSIYIHKLPAAETECRKAFELARKLGLETIVSEPEPETLTLLEKLCEEYNVKVAIHNHPQGSSRYWHPREVLKVCEGRSPKIGACADIGHWQRSGIKPVEGLRMLGDRLISIHVKDLHEAGPQGHDVPWGTGQGDIAGVLQEIQRAGIRPTLFTVEYEYLWDNNSPEIARCAEFFHKTVATLAANRPQEPHLLAGWAMADITPPKPIALTGQLRKRISTLVRDPLTATVLALETRREDGTVEQAVLVSCDVLFIQRSVQQQLRESLREKVPGLALEKVFLNATHTHTGPGFEDSTFGSLYDVSNDPGVMKASEYAAYFVERLAPAIVKAWQERRPASFSWALTHTVAGSNRRAHYFEGKTVMYGNTSTANFSHPEGAEDQALKLLFFWGPDKKLSGVVVNLPCTSQETEGLSEVSADFWHETRQALRQRLGENLYVLPQCAPAGDLSPHPIYRKTAEQLMEKRRGLSRRQEIARRITQAVAEVLPVARKDAQDRVRFHHTVATVALPEHQPLAKPFYETDPVDRIELHVLRLGEVAIATNPFELYLDYGIRMEARSQAVLTMLVQLSSGNCGYLPTARGVQGGGYSADNFIVGPVGGQVLVEETVRRINALWP